MRILTRYLACAIAGVAMNGSPPLALATTLGEVGAATGASQTISGTNAPSAARSVGAVRRGVTKPAARTSNAWRQQGSSGWAKSAGSSGRGSNGGPWTRAGASGRR
jgi:hypothetical protein